VKFRRNIKIPGKKANSAAQLEIPQPAENCGPYWCVSLSVCLYLSVCHVCLCPYVCWLWCRLWWLTIREYTIFSHRSSNLAQCNKQCYWWAKPTDIGSKTNTHEDTHQHT